MNLKWTTSCQFAHHVLLPNPIVRFNRRSTQMEMSKMSEPFNFHQRYRSSRNGCAIGQWLVKYRVHNTDCGREYCSPWHESAIIPYNWRNCSTTQYSTLAYNKFYLAHNRVNLWHDKYFMICVTLRWFKHSNHWDRHFFFVGASFVCNFHSSSNNIL